MLVAPGPPMVWDEDEMLLDADDLAAEEAVVAVADFGSVTTRVGGLP